jgi:hypothetical protein
LTLLLCTCLFRVLLLMWLLVLLVSVLLLLLLLLVQVVSAWSCFSFVALRGLWAMPARVGSFLMGLTFLLIIAYLCWFFQTSLV